MQKAAAQPMQQARSRRCAAAAPAPGARRIALASPLRAPSSSPLVLARAAAAGPSSLVAGSLASGLSLDGIRFHRPDWTNIKTEKAFFEFLQAEAAAGRFPPKLIPAWQDFFNNYRNAVLGSKVPGGDEAFVTQVRQGAGGRAAGRWCWRWWWVQWQWCWLHGRTHAGDGGTAGGVGTSVGERAKGLIGLVRLLCQQWLVGWVGG